MADAALRLQPRPRRPAGKAGRWLAIAGALLLGACQTLVPRTTEPTAAPPPPVTRPVPEAGVEPGIPQDAQRNRVALLVPLTGPNAGIGQSIANATVLALLDTNNQQVRVTNYDTAGGAAAAASRAIAEGAQLILGPLLAEDARAVGPVARVVSYARGRGVTSFAGLVPNGLYGERASTSLLRAVEGAGGSVVSLETYGRGPGQAAASAARLAGKGSYGAVLVADGGAAAAAVAPIVKRNGNALARLLGTELWNSEPGIGARPALTGAWFASVSNGLYRQYATKYRARYRSDPYRLSSLGYDAVLLTVRIARDWPVGRPFPESKLRDADGFAGLDGAFRFGRDNVAERALEVQEIRGGQTVTVSPAPNGFGR